MNSSSNGWYGTGPTSFQTRNVHESHIQIHYMTQAEPIPHWRPLRNEGGPSWSGSPGPLENPAGFQTAIPTYQLQHEPSSPSSGGFSALTPSQSLSAFPSDRSTGLFGGVQESSSPNETGSTSYLVRRRGISATFLTPTASRTSKEDRAPENAIDDVAGIGGATEEHLALLRGINGCSELDILIFFVQKIPR
jgi:hypothetical protein